MIAIKKIFTLPELKEEYVSDIPAGEWDALRTFIQQMQIYFPDAEFEYEDETGEMTYYVRDPDKSTVVCSVTENQLYYCTKGRREPLARRHLMKAAKLKK